jgi:hypothetical protein
MRGLAAASLLATAGTVCLVLKGWDLVPDWLRAGAMSPLAIRCLGWLLGGLVVLGILVAAMIRLRPASQHGHPRGLHRDQDGTAAIEFVFVLPLALMIFMVVTQAALLFNANMVVNYAVFSAARTAVTTLSLDIGAESRNLVMNPGLSGEGGSVKLTMIRRAAAMALVPVAGELSSAAQDVGDTVGKDIYQETRSLFGVFGKQPWGWFRRIEKNYNSAMQYTHIDLAKPEHWRDGDPDPDCPYRNSKRDDWNWDAGDWIYLPYCPYHPDRMDYYKWEDLKVRVIHQFLLSVPYANRFFSGKPATIPGYGGTQYQTEIRAFCAMMNEGGPDPHPTQ